MHYIIPIISSVLFRAGGMDQWKWCPLNQKWWRWIGIGLVIALITKQWLAIPAYLLVTNAMPYGEKSWLNFLGRDIKWIVYGLSFGACSFLCLPFGYGLTQALLGAASFWGLMKWSNDYELNHSWVEVGFGFMGTLMYLTKGG